MRERVPSLQFQLPPRSRRRCPRTKRDVAVGQNRRQHCLGLKNTLASIHSPIPKLPTLQTYPNNSAIGERLPNVQYTHTLLEVRPHLQGTAWASTFLCGRTGTVNLVYRGDITLQNTPRLQHHKLLILEAECQVGSVRWILNVVPFTVQAQQQLIRNRTPTGDDGDDDKSSGHAHCFAGCGWNQKSRHCIIVSTQASKPATPSVQ